MNRRSTGTEWERQAGAYLTARGMRLVESNFHGRNGEIDLIGYHEGYLVFVEVKYRKNDRGGHPLETVDVRKQRRVCRTAEYYCLSHGLGETTPCRFDVVGIIGNEIIHVEDAFLSYK